MPVSTQIARSPLHIRFQPWFAHWSWVVAAQDLARFIDLPTLTKRDYELSTADHAVARIPGAQRFCHLFLGSSPVLRDSFFDRAMGFDGLDAITQNTQTDENTSPPIYFAYPEDSFSYSDY
ncbi:hypothetical protein CH249_14360 [Rhodococcus sp. 05-2255-3B1]|nr:hypothetical protein CH249_14360 [Rhodococcus sp. 05-2255-3B1]OZE10260.1 hypothetical protein CH250_13280 [Rhodococcus sp. 05-2255-3C]OZE24387.1 hypothetical protein CH255_01935 [Rhodococcus sp. 05-2255-2A2]